MKREQNCGDLTSLSTQGATTWRKEVFVERPVTSSGHLHWQTDTILPVGSAPRTHMAEGLLTSSGRPEPCSHFLCQTGKHGRPGARPAAVPALDGVSHQPLPFLTSPRVPPPHLSGQTSSGERRSFPWDQQPLLSTLSPQRLGSQERDRDTG